jgi:hypothetical protein
MRLSVRKWSGIAVCVAVAGLLMCLWPAGCGGTGAFQYIGSPFGTSGGSNGTSGPSTTGRSGGSSFGGADRTPLDPCAETQSRKFIRISMRNLVPDDYIHYFLVLVAYISSETYPAGAVCPDDVPLYTSFGYIQIPDGADREFGNFCIVGPALLYFHEGGQFRSAGGVGASQLASAIAPAQGTVATFDGFFTAAGAQVPVPDLIIFHNPGTGDGGRLKVSRNSANPCGMDFVGATPACEQDAFYYVDERDFMTGSTALGPGSGRRVPNEIQDTGCAVGFNDPWYQLAPSLVSANNVLHNEFMRGSKIDFVFVREDQDPPFPQLVWRVIDATGAVAHDFDSRANVP